jgi:hypothetical protein
METSTSTTGTEGDSPTIAALADIATASRRLDSFAVILDGHGLQPKMNHGDLLIVSPTHAPAPGDAVVAVVPPITGRTRVYFVNGDADLYDGRGGYVAAGGWELLGTVVEVVTEQEGGGTG